MHSGANDTFNQVHIYDTSVQFYICSTFTSLYLLHMYTDVHMDKYMFFCGGFILYFEIRKGNCSRYICITNQLAAVHLIAISLNREALIAV